MSSSERCKASCTIEGYQEDEDEDMADDDQVEGKLSIQQILEGMTNEFNKAIKESDLKKAEPVTAEHVEVRNEETAAQVEGDQPAVNNESNTETLTEPPNNDPNEREKTDPTPVATNNIADEQILEKENGEGGENKDGLSKDKEDDGKKEGNIPRIVLTFRTIDEKTDHGKKTKISSCSSNLSLVPDELANCDQIGGVSVKIEIPEDQSEKSDSEENKKAAEKEKETEPPGEDKVKDEKEQVKQEGEQPVEKEMNDKNVPTCEPPRLRKRRTGRFRLRNNR